MKHKIFAIACLFILPFCSWSQCPTCEPDLSCISDEGPTACPEFLPDATANEYYEEVVTFYMPETFNDPQTGAEVTLNSVVVTNVVGIPFGLDFSLNDEDATYYPGEGQTHGCATVCGTPILPGQYNGTISIHAFATVFGIPIEVDEQFVLPLTVLEGEGTNNSFSFDQLSACGSLEVNFEGLINAEPQETGYDWNFGNGEISNDQFPVTQYYDEPGEYVVSLTTSLYQNELGLVQLDGLSDGWSGDIEELIAGFTQPDPYFTLEDGSGNIVFTSETVDDTQSNTWSGLGIPLNNPPYTINFYDEDSITEDDYLGSYSIELEAGGQDFDVNTGTNGNVNINLVVETEFYDEETVLVFDFPEANLMIDNENELLFIDNQEIVGYSWFLNDMVLENEIDSFVSYSDWGEYYGVYTNEFGCSNNTEIYVNCPDFTPEYNDSSDFIEAPEGFETYQWYLDGNSISGETDFFIEPNSFGEYTVQITTSYGCDVLSGVWNYVSIQELATLENIRVFPNPNDGNFTLDFAETGATGIDCVELYSETGHLIIKETLPEDIQQFNLKNQVVPGVYFIHIKKGQSSSIKRIAIF